MTAGCEKSNGLPVKPRLLVVVNVFLPDSLGGGAIFSDLCYALARRGVDVTVRCAYPYYPEWKDKSGRNGLRIDRYDDQGVHIERYGLFIPRNPQSLAQRLLHEASFLLSLSRSLFRGRDFDVVMAFCPLAGGVAFAVVNKWVHRKPLWLNIQDLSADAAAASRISRCRCVNRTLGALQAFLFNRADVWSSISPVMIDRLKQIRNGRQPIFYLPNTLNASLAAEIVKLPSKLGRAPRIEPKLLYAGAIGGKQDLLSLCKTLQSTKVRFSFRIHGAGGGASDLGTWIENTGDPRFKPGPFLTDHELAQALYEADYLVIPEKKGGAGAYAPSKILVGIASATPILAVSDPESALTREVRTENLGAWFSWENADRIGEWLSQSHTAPAAFLEWQKNELRRAPFFASERVVDAFERVLRALCAGGPIPDDLDRQGPSGAGITLD